VKTKSHNVHSELLLTLSPNNNISDSVRRFGLGDDTEMLVIVRIGGKEGDEKEVFDGMRGLVEGELGSVDMLDQGEEIDWSRLDKV
jgi:EKC/KEOPS complex subunit CGI121/TPRKB